MDRAISLNRGIRRPLLSQTRWKKGLREGELGIPGSGPVGPRHTPGQACHQGELGSRAGNWGHEILAVDGSTQTPRGEGSGLGFCAESTVGSRAK